MASRMAEASSPSLMEKAMRVSTRMAISMAEARKPLLMETAMMESSIMKRSMEMESSPKQTENNGRRNGKTVN